MLRARLRISLAFSSLLITLAGCATTHGPQLEYPSPDLNQKVFAQEGLASWYGPGFHGRKTASGKRYDQHDLTCAHRTLPFGTRLKITNLANGQELIVTVNDRGPFVRRRIVDVSHEVASQLDFLHKGTTRVRIETLPPETALEAFGAIAEVDPD